MERGAVLLLDEIDLATNKIMCLQGVLEGKAILIKKIGKLIHPKAGFTVVATANTKGKGSDDGRFIGTNVLNEAFLERFPVTFEQEYPEAATERKIITRELELLGIDTDAAKDIAKRWVEFAGNIRKTYFEGGVNELISTRRLVHMSRAYAIFRDEAKALRLCISRFDDVTRDSFLDLYRAHAPSEAPASTSTAVDVDNMGNPVDNNNDIPF
jgi:cobaltochelatase CobS